MNSFSRTGQLNLNKHPINSVRRRPEVLPKHFINDIEFRMSLLTDRSISFPKEPGTSLQSVCQSYSGWALLFKELEITDP